MTTLYYAPGSCALSCHIALEETGQPYQLALVDTAGGAQRAPEHLRLNPKGRVPVLTIGEQVLTESVAILTYIALLNPAAQLIPKDPLAAARVYEWLNYLSGHVHAATYRQMTRPHKFTTDEGGYHAVRASGKLQVREAAEFIEAQMQSRTWAIGEDYTIADALLLTEFRWFNRSIEPGFLANCPHWTAYAKRMEARPAVQRALAQEGISLWV